MKGRKDLLWSNWQTFYPYLSSWQSRGWKRIIIRTWKHKIKDRYEMHLNDSEYMKQPCWLGLPGRSVYDQYVIKIDCGWNIPLNHVGTFQTDVGSCWRSCKREKNLAAVYIWQYDGSDQTYEMKPALSRSTAINASRGGERIVAHTAITRALGFTMIRPSLYIFFNPSPIRVPYPSLSGSCFNLFSTQLPATSFRLGSFHWLL